MAEREQMESESFCSGFVEHFVRSEPAMGVEYEVLLCRAILEEISPVDVAAVAQYFDWSQNCMIKVTRPASGWLGRLLKRTVQAIDPQDVCAIFARVSQSRGSLQEWEQGGEETLEDVIMSLGPRVPGSISSRREHGSMEATELVLSNGMRLVCKRTRFLDDELQIKAFAYGGLSELRQEDKDLLLSCRLAPSVAAELGAVGVAPAELLDMMAGKRVSLEMDIGSYTRAFAGECSPNDMEAMMQMIYLLFTCPDTAVDENKVATLLKMQKEQVVNQWRSPQYCFSHLVSQVNTCGNEYFQPLTPADVDKVDVQAASHWYRKCFRNPGAFTMVVVGNFEQELLEHLAQEYLAAIPAAETSEAIYGDAHGLPGLPDQRKAITGIDMHFPNSQVSKSLTKWMVDPLCCTQMTYPLRIEASDMELRESMFLGHAIQVLESRLVEKMRFELGAIYNVSASIDFNAAHAADGEAITGTASIAWTCQPASVSTLVQVVLRELKAMQTEGPTQKEVDTRAEIARREQETSVKYNSWWVERFVTSFTVRCYKGDVGASFQLMHELREEVLEALQRSPHELQKVFSAHFPDVNHYTLVTLQPSFFTMLTSAINVRAEAILGNRMGVLTPAAVVGGCAAVAALLVLGFRIRRR